MPSASSMKHGMMLRFSAITVLAAQLAACSFDATTMDLREIERARTPNDSLACPAGVCRAQPDFDSPLFKLEKRHLLERAKAVISEEPRTKLVETDPTLGQLVFVQRSAVFGFPDTIRIQGAIVGTRTSLIIYSRSNYGFWDMGVNRGRVRNWLDKLTISISEERDRSAVRPS